MQSDYNKLHVQDEGRKIKLSDKESEIDQLKAEIKRMTVEHMDRCDGLIRQVKGKDLEVQEEGKKAMKATKINENLDA